MASVLKCPSGYICHQVSYVSNNLTSISIECTNAIMSLYRLSHTVFISLSQFIFHIEICHTNLPYISIVDYSNIKYQILFLTTIIICVQLDLPDLDVTHNSLILTGFNYKFLCIISKLSLFHKRIM